MEVRRHGPTRAPGTAVIEREGGAPIQTGGLGYAAMLGLFEKGTPGEAVFASSARALARIFGGRHDGLYDASGSLVRALAPDAAQDYFAEGGGYGGFVGVRITDGTEVAAEVKLFGRKLGGRVYDPDGGDEVKTAVLKVVAKSGGRWGGQGRRYYSYGAAGSVLTATTATTGVTMDANELAGGTLRVALADGSVYQDYEIVSNTAAGVVTVKSDSAMSTLFPSGNVHVLAMAAPVTLDTGAAKRLGVKVSPASNGSDSSFALSVFADGFLVKTWDNLSMDRNSTRFVENVVSADAANYEIDVTSLVGAGVTVTADHRPSNFYAMPLTVVGKKVTFQTFHVASVDEPANVIVGQILEPDDILSAYRFDRPYRLTFTWVAGTTKYTVAMSEIGGTGVGAAFLPDFSCGATTFADKVYDPGLYYPKVVLDHVSAPTDGAEFAIDVIPVPGEAVSGRLAPDATDDHTRHLIIETDYNYAKIESGDLSGVTVATKANVTGTADISGGVTVDATNNLINLKFDGRTLVDVTLSLGASQTTDDVVDDINARVATLFPQTTPVIASNSGGKVKLTSPGGPDGAGIASSIEVINPGSNDALTILGFTAGTTYGTDGDEMLIECESALWGGYDGLAPDVDDYLDALSLATGALRGIDGQGYGTLMVSIPGVTEALTSSTSGSGSDAETVQRKAADFCYQYDHVCLVEYPVSVTTEQVANSYLTNVLGRNDCMAAYFPGWVNVPDPDKTDSNKSIPVSGQVSGLWALVANQNGHYGAPAAGDGYRLSRVVSLPTGGTRLDEEFLTPRGVNVIKRRGASYVVWGGRSASANANWRWVTQRLQMNHYKWIILESFDWVIFRLNDQKLWGELRAVLLDYFIKEWQRGALYGESAGEAVTVKIDSENNTAVDRENGDLNAQIVLTLPNFVERFVVNVSKAGVSIATA